MQYACAVLSFVACPALKYFSTLSHTRHRRKKYILKIKCVFWFYQQPFFETFLILRRTERDVIRNVYRSSCKVPVIFVLYQWKLVFLDRFSKNPEIPIVMKIRPVESELFHADGQTDRHDEDESLFFCNFTKAPENSCFVFTVIKVELLELLLQFWWWRLVFRKKIVLLTLSIVE